VTATTGRSRAPAALVHIGGGLFWALALAGASYEVGGTVAAFVWVGSAFVMWLFALVDMLGDPAPWRTTFRWWLGSFVAPVVLIAPAGRSSPTFTGSRRLR
jgi:hypothetical protein